ncbi:UDP-N-acetylglucosamine--N-acetylmuramyl-(pentapeptide) pyrophosphoryl-undecaprenol N-acetylglucosamine transferase [Siminovitchia terrae]|uniref:UDP-N-acetylglucosamine--N-acetylmuramyl-(pentapeptide) pyrophosphoryl-undecaprenol N-acetylglucosamine transferase n=1 Tax=Siminovitchia terrae TaxID=1914933 RepID=A0A429XBK8_SIMTE|nr:undecaprenyldiphospho-muramoylpentapeptide beta-N-acetylglucosaminyltransferase [Siminovitchia terrae]RST60837.1 undecaprenyldiphospho-muramoylpentapeptide beta-N-acetylglucosaminyltransferase [Siminovitchia terrae]GIN91457.1 UDP-N-acetylglucosamine--N-acetylmuramyl-(pentapeptide) pyrophosphoryl-undecaprenol N-acetylglucosamine transferase [Siminovitchia terrae]GIN94607.1 UDP-N-acetylglucosamine--N-acetylmuramyl-(pentapeptide) pyrophosphoryl-undecaprenol N-acetylglucosamine transferase [Simin
MKIIVSGGGTGGHVYPALALIRTIKKKHPDTKFLYIGTERGLESNIIRRENIPFEAVEITGFRRSLSFENIKTVLRFLKGVKRSKQIINDFKPDAVIGTGGYVSAPVVYAAAKKKVPAVIHEQNSVPGLTNKFLSKYVQKVALCFDSAKEFFPAQKVILTGNPRASEVVGKESRGELVKLGLKENIPTALITGGSRGARPINEAVIKSLAQLTNKPYQVLYITGEVHFEDVKKEVELIGASPNVVVVPFIHNMEEVLTEIDVVVGRAGATSLAEITALGLPSILIPSPYVTNNHQEKNASVLTSAGAAIMLQEKDLSSQRLMAALDEILLDDKKRQNMSEASKKLGMPDASDRLYDVLLSMIERGRS